METQQQLISPSSPNFPQKSAELLAQRELPPLAGREDDGSPGMPGLDEFTRSTTARV